LPSVLVRLGSVAYFDAANLGYGIGLDPDGHRIEFIGSWAVLAPSGKPPVRAAAQTAPSRTPGDSTSGEPR